MKKDTVMYDVEITRRKREIFFERKYRAYVEVRINDKYCSELTGGVYASTLSGVKKKAIKKILSVERETGKGVTFGMVFRTNGCVSDVITALGGENSGK